MEMYEGFADRTRSGAHRKTALFRMRYIDLVELYLLFSPACHTNDLELFIYSLGKMCTVLFATNPPHYARWMVRYHLDLLNVDQSHLGVRQMLKTGALTIRRTSKPFSRSPVDLTLEQTVNADAEHRGRQAYLPSLILSVLEGDG